MQCYLFDVLLHRVSQMKVLRKNTQHDMYLNYYSPSEKLDMEEGEKLTRLLKR